MKPPNPNPKYKQGDLVTVKQSMNRIIACILELSPGMVVLILDSCWDPAFQKEAYHCLCGTTELTLYEEEMEYV